MPRGEAGRRQGRKSRTVCPPAGEPGNRAAAVGPRDATWRLLRHVPDPSARSWIIHGLAPLGADPRSILHRLDEEDDISARRALILCLGEFGLEQLSAADRDAFAPRLLAIYRDDPDAGVHGAAEWLLRQWKQEGKIRLIDQRLAATKREVRLLATAKSASGLVEDEVRQPAEADNTKSWYINGQGQTMVILHGPVQFMMGSPADEKDHQSDETLRPKGILRSFAIAGKAVTVAEFKRFAPPSATARFNAARSRPVRSSALHGTRPRRTATG